MKHDAGNDRQTARRTDSYCCRFLSYGNRFWQYEVITVCGLMTFAIVLLAMPALIVVAIAMLALLSVLCVPIIFVGWLIGEIMNNYAKRE